MTEFLKEWTMTLAGIIVFGSLCEMILPDGVYKKYIHLAIGLMLCLSVLSPVAERKFESGVDYFADKSVYETLGEGENMQKDEIIRIYKNKLCESMTNEAKKASKLDFDIKCDIDEDEKSFGKIKNVWITVDANKGERFESEAVERLKRVYGIDENVISIKYLK